MKKLFFLLMITGFMLSACNHLEREEKTFGKPLEGFDFSKVATISPGDATKMAALYNQMVYKDPKKCIQHINMDGEVLEAILFDTKTIQLIAAADTKTNAITAIVALNRGGTISFYDINSFFNSSQPGMRGKPPICPPPDPCGRPLSTEATKHTLVSPGDAEAMAKLYVGLVQANPKIAIQQVTMDGTLLEVLLYKTQGVQLIAAADLNTKEPTEIIQFWRDRVFSYYDIRHIFPKGMPGKMMSLKSSLCPPPDTCRFITSIDTFYVPIPGQ
jgi:hypothetical protein